MSLQIYKHGTFPERGEAESGKVKEFLMGVGVILLIILGSAFGAQLLYKAVEASKECTTNSQCGNNSYCGADFKCHDFPIPQTPDYTMPALIIAIGLVGAAYFYGGKTLPKQAPPLLYK
ncbi:MAG: hypothetical protein HY363_03275 [Candidatus Aenigmarchaeota archaeon]|nr:hypothetical protein [Candidatus Aenigmarchaeota archaeon]